jgi:hypothetical protein
MILKNNYGMVKESTNPFKMASKGEVKQSMMGSPKRDYLSIERDQVRLDEIKNDIRTKHVTPTMKMLNLGKMV